ncbi:MAG: hypothetical protein AAF830_13560 [Pseudomonadota bacterium]
MNNPPQKNAVRKAPVIRTRPFGWLTDDLLVVFEREPARLRVWMAATRREWHFAGMVFALLDNKARFDEIEAMLFVRKKTEILHAACPGADPKLIKLAGKLCGKLWRPATYRSLAALVRDPSASRLLLRARRIDRRQVMALAKVPATLRCPAVFARLKKRSDAEKLTFAIGLVERIRPTLGRDAVLRSLAQTKPNVPLEAWVRKHFRAACFPAPPWAGTDKLKPLDNWDAIQRTALSFKNCIRTYVRDVLAGSCYLYLYRLDGKDTAVVEFIRLADGVWAIDEIEGPDNVPLAPAVEADVIAEAAGAALKLPGDASVWAWADPSH